MKKYIFAAFSLAIILFIFYPSKNNIEKQMQAQTKRTIAVTTPKNKSLTKDILLKSSKIIPLKCNTKLEKKLMHDIQLRWLQLKDKLQNDPVEYKLIRLAFSLQKPQFGAFILPFFHDKTKVITKDKATDEERYQQDQQNYDLLMLLAKKGLDAVLNTLEHQELNHFDLSKQYGFLGKIITIIQLVKTEPLPSNEQLERLLNLGYKISNEDYVKASAENFPVSFMARMVALGPLPESLNGKYRQAPIFAAAKRGDREQVKFWLERNYLFKKSLPIKNFTDLLLLNATTQEDLEKNWQLLQQWGLTLRDPQTARTLLERKSLQINPHIISELIKLKKETIPRFKLQQNERHSLIKIVSEIVLVNKEVKKILQPVTICLQQKNEDDSDKQNNVIWVRTQFENGMSTAEIIQTLSKKDPFLVDKFRRQAINGLFRPFILPLNRYKKLTPSFYKMYASISSGDFENIRLLLQKKPLDNLTLALLISDEKKLPDDIIRMSKQAITEIPPSMYINNNWISAELLEEMNIDPISLNQLDEQQKNLFYYATKSNKPKLMRWLAEHQADLISDEYGSDPMDVVLRWNTNRETLQTLCDLNFPIKQKHKKKFLEIQQNDTQEAEEILQICPQFLTD